MTKRKFFLLSTTMVSLLGSGFGIREARAQSCSTRSLKIIQEHQNVYSHKSRNSEFSTHTTEIRQIPFSLNDSSHCLSERSQLNIQLKANEDGQTNKIEIRFPSVVSTAKNLIRRNYVELLQTPGHGLGKSYLSALSVVCVEDAPIVVESYAGTIDNLLAAPPSQRSFQTGMVIATGRAAQILSERSARDLVPARFREEFLLETSAAEQHYLPRTNLSVPSLIVSSGVVAGNISVSTSASTLAKSSYVCSPGFQRALAPYEMPTQPRTEQREHTLWQMDPSSALITWYSK